MKNFMKTLLVSSLIIISCFISIDAHPDDIYWDEGFGYPAVAYAGFRIYDIVEYNGDIVFGGYLDRMAAVPSSEHIATWNGKDFQGLDHGVKFVVKGLAVYDDKIIAGGELTYNQGDASIFAVWDGDSWDDLDFPYKGGINDVVTYKNKLFVAGYFDVDDNYEKSKLVVMYDGNEWHRLPGKMSSGINKLVVFQDKLIAAGWFSKVDTTRVDYLAEWDGFRWKKFETDVVIGDITHAKAFDDFIAVVKNSNELFVISTEGKVTAIPHEFREIYDLGEYKNQLIISVLENNNNEFPLKRWNGQRWENFAGGVYGYLHSLYFKDNMIYGFGHIKKENHRYPWAGAFWDGNEWDILSGNGISEMGTSNFAVYNQKLLVGGWISFCGDQDVYGIGMFDGEEWDNFGISEAWQVSSIFVNGDSLIIGDFFNSLGVIEAHSAAMWDGSQWIDLSFTEGSFVSDFAIYKGDLFAAGNLRTEANPTTFRLAMRKDDQWVPLPEQPNGWVNEILVFKDNLYIGGNFDSIGSIYSKNIASWNGQNWEGIEVVMEPDYSEISKLRIIRDKLAVIGSFYRINGMLTKSFVFWDGNVWSTLEKVPLVAKNDFIGSVVEYQNELVFAGHFDSIGGVMANNIASWDGETFHPLGSGIELNPDFPVYGDWARNAYELIVYNDNLYVGGEFYQAGRKTSSNIARWTKKNSVPVVEEPQQNEKPDKFILYPNYPNPFNPETEISYALSSRGNVSLVIYNIIGQKVQTLVDKTQQAGNYTVRWNGKGCASGVYFYRLTVDDFVDEKKMILLK